MRRGYEYREFCGKIVTGDLTGVKEICETRPDILFYHNTRYGLISPLIIATGFLRHDIVAYLIEKGFDVNNQDNFVDSLFVHEYGDLN